MKDAAKHTRREWISVQTVEEEGRDGDEKPPPVEVDGCGVAVSSHAAVNGSDAERASESDWGHWQWQLRNRIRSLPDLVHRFPELTLTSATAAAAAKFPMAITPYYASLMRRSDSGDPIFRMCVPMSEELRDPAFLSDDPLHEDDDMPVPGLIHRYRDRALLIATTSCSVYCRHCTRKRVAGQTETCISPIRLTQATEYLSVHPEVKDVIISGGDPLTMSTPALERIIKAVRSVESVEIIRIGTRVPVVLPMRVTRELVNMLRRYHPLYVNTHFNHPVELTREAEAACTRLADAGIPMGNQTVLLHGVNDNAQLLADLFRRLVRTRVRPYYLFQCDLVRGVEHFRTPLSKGIEIMEYLRGRLSGLAIPTFVVDAPYGGGKIPLLPNYVVSSSPTHTVLRNFAGDMVSYPEPEWPSNGIGYSQKESASTEGVWSLSSGLDTRLSRGCLPDDSGRSGRGAGENN